MSLRRLFILLALLVCTTLSHAGLLAGSTRVIYNAGERERSLMLANTNDYPVVVQTWIDQGEGNPDDAQAPFIVLPAVFRLQPNGIQGLRILFGGDALPDDRESVYWLNLYEIPPTASETRAPAQIDMAMNTQLKVFYRPAGLTPEPAEVPPRLEFSLRQEGEQWYLQCRNPTPFHASFARLTVEGDGRVLEAEQEMDMMTSPFAERRYRLGAEPPPAGARLRFWLINDAGFPVEHEAALAR